ncbi:ion channel [Sulfitobacter sp. MF3-043]|uniref:ion channel n=1 Tax=Sulfitobacter sediminivivens TaxID=3252902 RepID=UPI0036DEF447
MNVVLQIAMGSGLLILCGVLHVALAAHLIAFLRLSRPFEQPSAQQGFFRLPVAILLAFVLSHTLHVYLWATTVWAVGALPGYEAPIYFALVTYTTLGYGDVTLDPAFRIFGAMASVTGILMFGMTTAFLVGVFARALGAGQR